MVKADAYNHGLEGVAKISERIVDRYGVATIEEAVSLRRLGIRKPISIFSYECKNVKEIKRYDVTPVVYSIETFREIEKNNVKNFEIKIDSGMNRFGFKCQDEIRLLFQLMYEHKTKPRAIHTHFYSPKSVFEQTNRFEQVISPYYKQLGGVKRILSATTGLLHGVIKDGVRIGIEAYKGALKVTSKILSIKPVFVGETIGYDGKYQTNNDTKVAIVSGGYYDGIRQEYSGMQVFLNNRATRIVGRICMDTTIIDVGSVEASVGDEVIIIDSNNLINVKKQYALTDYEIITSIKGRAKRTYTYNGQKYNPRTN